MLNILVPLSGGNTFKVSSENKYPKILTNIEGKLLIERAAKPFLDLKRKSKITVALPQPESDMYQLDNVLSLLGEHVKACTINGNTQGAVCSALLAIEDLDFEAPLIITSFEQVIDVDINELIDTFLNEEVDAGVLTFEAMHPKWSYVKTDINNYVTQAAEKMPISKKAVAGLYYFKSVNLFVESAKSMIRKDVKTNGNFYISPTLNEIILNEGKVKAIDIDKSCYFHVNDDHELSNYEKKIHEEHSRCKSMLLDRTRDYISAFDSKNIIDVANFFMTKSVLCDASGIYKGLDDISSYIESIFSSANEINFKERNVYFSGDLNSVVEFELNINGTKFIGVDIIEWTPQLSIRELRAYLYEV